MKSRSLPGLSIYRARRERSIRKGPLGIFNPVIVLELLLFRDMNRNMEYKLLKRNGSV